jgi:hypothetical protein
MSERGDEPKDVVAHIDTNERTLIGLSSFEALGLDSRAVGADNVPVRWFLAASVAEKLGFSRRDERKQFLRTLATQEHVGDGPPPWECIGGAGTVVDDLAAAARVLVRVGTEAFAGGAPRLAYSIAVGTRIALVSVGPASVRGDATYLQAQVLRAFGYKEETQDTLREALEDAVRSNHRELEGKVLAELSAEEARFGRLGG